jgi:ApeA N-terminal domain 1
VKPFEARGTWWVPGDRRRRNATGTISYSPDIGGALDVFGKRLDSSPSLYERVFHGDTERGPITLLGCTFERASKHDSSQQSAQQLSCEIVLLGAHVKADFLIDHAVVRVKNLDQWAHLGIMEPLGSHRQKLENAGPSFYYRREPGPRATLADGAKITLGVTVSESFGNTEASVAVEHQFNVNLAQSMVLNETLDGYVTPLVDLLTVVTDHPSSILSLRVTPKSAGRKNSFSYLSPQLDVGLRIDRSVPEEKPVAPLATQVVRFDEFIFGKQLPLWFGLARKLRSIHGLVFGLRYATNMSVENRYLNASTAAEALHRATFSSNKSKVDLRNEATKQWLSQYPDNERQLIKSRLTRYINDPSLGDRLRDLLDKAGIAFQVLVPTPTKWLTRAKNIRNDLTHQEGAPRVNVNSAAMFLLAESLALLVTICLMIDIGYTPEDVQAKLVRSLRIRVLQEEMREQFPELYVEPSVEV